MERLRAFLAADCLLGNVPSFFLLLATRTPNSYLILFPSLGLFKMSSRSSKQPSKLTTTRKKKQASSASLELKMTAETAQTRPGGKVSVEPLPESTKVDHSHLSELPNYNSHTSYALYLLNQ